MDNKRTGILASMGPTLEEIDDICFALNNGVSNFRIHLGLKTRDYCKYFRNAVKSAEITKKDIEVLLDLPSSRPRIGKFPGCELKKGDIIKVVNERESNDKSTIPLFGIDKIIPFLHINDYVTFRDGRIKFRIIEIEPTSIKMECVSAILPLVQMCSCLFMSESVVFEPYIQEDVEALYKIKNEGLVPNWIALSFASEVEQINKLKCMINQIWPNKPIKTMAKIENRKGIKNLDKLLEVCEGVMVARGDLLLNINPITLPMCQKQIIDMCKNRGKVSVVATEVLDSLADKGIINRAELSDIALAVRQGASAIMLARESGNSQHAKECIQLLNKIIEIESKNITFSQLVELI